MLFVQVAAELEVLALAEMVEEEERQVKEEKRKEVETHIIDLVMEREAHIVLVIGVRPSDLNLGRSLSSTRSRSIRTPITCHVIHYKHCTSIGVAITVASFCVGRLWKVVRSWI